MINSIEQLIAITPSTPYQTKVLGILNEIFIKVNVNTLSENSFISTEKKLIIISFVHKDDYNTNVTLNIKTNESSLWYTSCNLLFEDDSDLTELKQHFYDAVIGNYQTVSLYFKRKQILDVTNFIGQESTCYMPRSFFYKLYIRFGSKYITSEIVNFKSFLFSDN